MKHKFISVEKTPTYIFIFKEKGAIRKNLFLGEKIILTIKIIQVIIPLYNFGTKSRQRGLKRLPLSALFLYKIVTIQKVVSREVFWHVFCQNPETYKAKCHHRR